MHTVITGRVIRMASIDDFASNITIQSDGMLFTIPVLSGVSRIKMGQIHTFECKPSFSLGFYSPGETYTVIK